jgi:hypothetical protein
VPVLILLAALSAMIAAWRRRKRALPASAVIVSPRKSSVIARDGTVRSVQTAELTLSRQQLDRLWSPPNLENLARTYWLFLSRVTLGLIRVVYGQNERSVVFLGRPLTLLRFDAPEYVVEPDHGQVTWRIRDGLLVARAGRGCGSLRLDVRRLERDQPETGEDHLSLGVGETVKVRIEVEVANFYPAIAAGFSMPVYEATQSAIHVLVTHAFLRSLAKLRLARSKVGRLRRAAGAAARGRSRDGRAGAQAGHVAPVDRPASQVTSARSAAAHPAPGTGARFPQP